ncbi:MAG: hypothetical protein ACI4J5_08780 [Oscillospiraceae bacterium]
MNKSLKRTVSLAASLAMAVSALPAIGASAKSNDVYTSSYTWYNAQTEKYYDTKDEAIAASSAADVYNGYTINFDYRVNFSLAYPYYSTYTQKYYPTVFAANAVSKGDESMIIYGGPDGSPVYDSNHTYYSSYTKRFYATYAEALAHSSKVDSYVIKTDGKTVYTSNTVYAYYSSYTNKYYSTYSDALLASRGISSYVTTVYSYTANSGSGEYYNNQTNRWYPTLSEALAASNNNVDYVYFTGSEFKAYKFGTKYYASKADAMAAGGTDDTITEYTFTGRTAPSKTYTTTVNTAAPVYYNGYYYNGYYYYGYPYYYYYGYPYYYYYNTTTLTTAGEGVPYLKGYSTKHSWSTLTSYAKNAKSGATIQITMNGATTVPDSFMSAIKGRNVTVVFNMDNGVTWTVKGTSVTTAKTVNLSVSYNADNIPNNLVKKATKDAIAAAEVSVGTGDGSDLGFKGSCTIKFSSNRANQFAKSYVYDKDDNNLTLVSKSMTNDSGYVSFVASENGTYLVVLS